MKWPIITKETTLEEIQAIHKKIWDYAIKHGHKPETPYINNCVACEYARIKIQGNDLISMCPYCPIKWDYGRICNMDGSLYDCYNRSEIYGNLVLMRTYAKEIRDVDFKRS